MRRTQAPLKLEGGELLLTPQLETCEPGDSRFFSDLLKSQKDSTGAPSVDFRVITGFQIIGQPLNSESVDNEDPLR